MAAVESSVMEQELDASRLTQLRHRIEHAAHLLPAQGPINVFVHHNTLHAFEEFSFKQAVIQGANIFGCHPYLPEEQYRRELSRGRIRREDLFAVLIEELGDEADRIIGFMGTRFELRMAMLEHPLLTAPSAELRWLIAETDALRCFRREVSSEKRDQMIRQTRHWILRDLRNGSGPKSGSRVPRIAAAVDDLIRVFDSSSMDDWSDATWESFVLHLLWRICHHGVHGLPRFVEPSAAAVRHRDWLYAATGEDSDQPVHEILIRFTSSFLDQGLANWALPGREEGFFRAFQRLYGQRFGPPDPWLRGLSPELRRLEAKGIGPLASIRQSLDLLGVASHEEDSFLSATLLALRGWAGMIHQVETRGDRVAHPAQAGTLIEFLAVRLILERLSLAHLSQRALGFTGSLAALRSAARARAGRPQSVSVEQRAFNVFQLAQVRDWKPEDLYRLSKVEWSLLVEELEAFSAVDRRQVFHAAFERRYRNQVLDAIAIHTEKYWIPIFRPVGLAASEPAKAEPARPSFQIICCIDDREESFRRYLEALDPRCETLSTAGFFAVPMYYCGIGDAHAVPLCPIIMKPQHYVREEVPYTLLEEHRRRAAWRRILGQRSHAFHRSSRTFLGGVITALLGPLASIPLVARVLFPRLTAQVRRTLGWIVRPPVTTRLTLERSEPTPGTDTGQLGFTIEEMANNVERLLRDIGLTSHLARLILVTGHGSSSLNNPHESAYNCGACGGGRGGPNARALATMANEPRVRKLLAERGVEIPVDTVFLGAYHNTCDDSVTFYGLEQLPLTHAPDFDHLKRTIDKAREHNARERCRRFASADLKLSPEAALRHVEARAEDLSQTRPEYNHATNAICIVGRRSRTCGLFLDRRSFLQSYDPRQDDEQRSILTRILQAVVPVCAGINLEYYFSTVDVSGYGCGTKLPHNVTSLLGVMDGAASDLRTGLSAQMTEIHEPVRLLFVIEATPQAMRRIMDRNPVIDRLCGNDWVQVATLDPDSSTIHVLRGGEFQLYFPEAAFLEEAATSVDWYRNWRDHLGFAHIAECLSRSRTAR